jgi:hypothetical protein
MTKKKLKLASPLRQKKQQLISFAVVFGVIGTVLLLKSFAATPYLSIEAENGTRSGSITEGTDANASGTGGKFIVFNAGSYLKYEAEAAQTTAQIITSGKDYASGAAVVGVFGSIGQYVTFTVNVPSAGNYPVNIRYASAYGGTVNSGPDPLPRTMLINGAGGTTVSFARTTNIPDNWNSLVTKSLGSLSLNSGSNTITFRIDANEGQYWDVDYIEVKGATIPTVCPTGQTGTPPNCVTSNGGSFNSGKIEAEGSGVNRIHLDKNCYHWSWATNSARDSTDSVASGGAFCGSFGATDTVNWDKLSFAVNSVPTAGNYTLRIWYRNSYGSDSQNTLVVNGVGRGALDFSSNTTGQGEDYGQPFGAKIVTVPLNAGSNTIEFDASVGFTNFVDLDYFEVLGTAINPPPTGTKCVVDLHGRGSGGGQPFDGGNFTIQAPQANQPYGGGWVWIYFPDGTYQQMLGPVTAATSGCGQVILHGFSNGAAAAANIYCRGESFGGKLVGVIVDDPVMDNGADNCAPASGVKVSLYFTGGIPYGPQSCIDIGFTCNQDQLIGIPTYSSRLGTSAKQSVNFGHSPYSNPPELSQWW